MREIPVKNSDKVIFVDDQDYEYLIKWSWYVYKEGYPVCWVREERRMRPMHKIITNTGLECKIDHINRNKLDNRRENFRIGVNDRQNTQNQGKRANKQYTSIYKGVVKTAAGTFMVTCSFNQCYHREMYTSEIAAAYAYNKMVLLESPEFGVLNKLDLPIQELEQLLINTRCTLKRILIQSKYKGIRWKERFGKYRNYGKWMASVWHNNKHNHVGTFNTELEAVEARRNYINMLGDSYKPKSNSGHFGLLD